MAKVKGMTSNEKHFRQWWAVKSNGYIFSDSATYSVKQGISDIVRTYNDDCKGERTITYPTCKTYITSIVAEVRAKGQFDTYIEDENFGFEISTETVDFKKSDMSKTISVGSASADINEQTKTIMSSLSDVMECDGTCDAIELDQMEFDSYDIYKTDTVLDKIMSDDYGQGNGCYSRNIIVLVGESGVGKSTVLLDVIGRMRQNMENKKDAKYVYVSTEMLKSDLFFYLQKNPMAKHVPTIPLMSQILSGKAVDSIIEIFLTDKYDFIVLDSFQDLLVKLVQYCGLKPSQAETMLINLLLASAEKFNKTIIAIQHMTKGGEYVGKTLLKHTITAMAECRFENGERYIKFSKNRRGGDVQELKVFYNMNKQTKQMEYDSERFYAQLNSRNISKDELHAQRMNNLIDIMEQGGAKTDSDDDVIVNLNQTETTAFENEVFAEFEDVSNDNQNQTLALLENAINQSTPTKANAKVKTTPTAE